MENHLRLDQENSNPRTRSSRHYSHHHRSKSRMPLTLWLSVGLILNLARSIEALTGSDMKVETFDTSDHAASFCDTRRFDVVEGTSGLVHSHRPYYPSSVYRSGRDCFMTLKAPAGYRIELRALEFQIGERFAGQTKKCAGDSLHIFDQDKPDPSPKKARSHHSPTTEYQDEKSLAAILNSNTSVQSPIKANLCGRIPNNTIIAKSTMNIMTLWWHSDPNGATTGTPLSAAALDPRMAQQQQSQNVGGAKRGFKLQWTAFRDAGVNGCDEEKEFMCSSDNTCIPVELACDNAPHCNDRSDLSPERQRAAGCTDIEFDPSTTTTTFSIGSLTGVCIGSLLLLVLAILLINVCRKRRRLARRQQQHQHKYNQAPVMTSNGTPAADKHLIAMNGHHHPQQHQHLMVNGNGNNSSNSSNSADSRCASSSNDSRNQIYNQRQPNFAHPYQSNGVNPQQQPQQQQQHLYHQIGDADQSIGGANGAAYYQPYYVQDGGLIPAYQTKLYHHHQHLHHHQQPPPPPLAPPPSTVGFSTGGGQNGKAHQQSYYHQLHQQQQQQQQGLSDQTQPMIA